MMVNIIFGQPCCSDPENFINLITPNDNQLTHTFRQLLQKDKLVRREYRLSLFRVLDMLNDRLYGKCCDGVVTFDYSGVNPSGVTAQFYDLVTGDLIFATNPTGPDVQQFTVPAKYFGAAALIKIQLNVIAAPPTLDNYTVSDQNDVVYFQATQAGVTTYPNLQSIAANLYASIVIIMPTIYRSHLNIEPIDTGNLYTQVIIDSSSYFNYPDTPLLDVTIPGYIEPFTIAFKASLINVLNSSILGLNAFLNQDSLIVLPDGIWKFVYKICPHDQMFTVRNYFQNEYP